MSASTVVQLVYAGRGRCFVLGLHLMNSPATARRGNQVSAAGMIVAVVATLGLHHPRAARSPRTGWIVMLAGALLGGGAGLYAARRSQMTAMPQLVSVFNAVGGGAAALVAIDDYISLAGAAGGVAGTTTVPTVLDMLIGAVTFSGSVHRRRQAAGAGHRAADHLPRRAAGQRGLGRGRRRRRAST